MLLHCRQVGARMIEIPIVFTDRKEGSSKVGFSQICRSLYDLFYVATVKRRSLRPVYVANTLPESVRP